MCLWGSALTWGFATALLKNWGCYTQPLKYYAFKLTIEVFWVASHIEYDWLRLHDNVSDTRTLQVPEFNAVHSPCEGQPAIISDPKFLRRCRVGWRCDSDLNYGLISLLTRFPWSRSQYLRYLSLCPLAQVISLGFSAREVTAAVEELCLNCKMHRALEFSHIFT